MLWQNTFYIPLSFLFYYVSVLLLVAPNTFKWLTEEQWAADWLPAKLFCDLLPLLCPVSLPEDFHWSHHSFSPPHFRKLSGKVWSCCLFKDFKAAMSLKCTRLTRSLLYFVPVHSRFLIGHIIFFPLLLLPSIHPSVHSSIKPSIHQLPEDRNASPALLSSIWWACFSCICPVMPFFAPSLFTRWHLWLFYPSSHSFYFSEVSICNTWSIFCSNWSQVSCRFFCGNKALVHKK